MGYRIKTVAERLGIPKNTLIAWEQRYAFPRPARLPNGYRIYSEQDVADLEALKRLLDSGLQISEALERMKRMAGRDRKRDSPPALERGLSDARLEVEHAAPPALTVLEPIWRSALQRLLEFDRPGAEQALIARTGLPFPLQIDGLYFPLLRELGAGWERGTMSVAQEHFASAFCRDHLALMLLQLEGRVSSPATAVCATISGDRHELGALGLAVQLAFAGHRVVYLGADVPVEELYRCALRQETSGVWVSIIRTRPEAEVLEYARTLRRALPPAVRVVIGGSGLPKQLVGTMEHVELARRYEEVLGPRS